MHIISIRGLARAVAALLAAAVSAPAPAASTPAAELVSPHAFTFYSGRISSLDTWHDVLIHPFSKDYTDEYLIAGAYNRVYGQQHFDGALRTEYEVNAAYHFGEQSYWELNFAPVTLRWQRFPWSDTLHTTVAFGLGLSYDFKYSEVEDRLENDTKQLLLFWQLEMTAGPREGPWSGVLRLHHRSPGWGVMGVADGGSNAPSLGFRYEF